MTNRALLDPETNYRYYRENTAYQRNDDRLREQRNHWIRDRILSKARTSDTRLRVLDVGCNDGVTAELLGDTIDWEGIELNPIAAANAYPRARDRITIGNAMMFEVQKGTYDVIIVAETLEHVPNPTTLLRRFIPALRPNGFLLTTSAVGHGEGHEPGNLEHLIEWNPTEWRNLHREAGLRVIESGLSLVYGRRYTNIALSVPEEAHRPNGGH